MVSGVVLCGEWWGVVWLVVWWWGVVWLVVGCCVVNGGVLCG